VHSQVDLFSEAVARRFRTKAVRTVFANTISKDPIAISSIDMPAPTGRWTEKPAPESAFAIHIVMAPLPRMQTRIERRWAKIDPLNIADVCLFDLSKSPITLIRDPLASVRVHISQRTLDDLAYDRGQRSIAGLQETFGDRDPVLHGLSCAFLQRQQLYGDADPLFFDHVALAFHNHLAQVYGQLPNLAKLRGGLAPWQLRRARELMLSRLSGKVAIAELAEVCGLSASYFARAFRRSAGMPAHKWLMKERIERAKELLLNSSTSLPDVALACGFADQSHLTKVFSLTAGRTPARWRRERLD
jgi:AraC family transcriptional regulator